MTQPAYIDSFLYYDKVRSIVYISIDEIYANRDRWVDTSFVRTDGKTEYREKTEFGNRHAVFELGATVGVVHIDLHNATDVPVGTIKHFTNYVEEKTGIPQSGLDLLIALGVLYGVYRLAKWGSKNL